MQTPTPPDDETGHPSLDRSPPSPTTTERLAMLLGCAQCPAKCCQAGIVSLTAPDLARLAKHLGEPPDAVAVLLHDQTNLGSLLVSVDAPEVGCFVRARPLPEGTTARDRIHWQYTCRFLVTDDEGAQSCGVYEARPGICRLYPFSMGAHCVVPVSGYLCDAALEPLVPAVQASPELSEMLWQNVEWHLQSALSERWNMVVASEELEVTDPTIVIGWLHEAGEAYWEIRARYGDDATEGWDRHFLPHENPFREGADTAGSLAGAALAFAQALLDALPDPSSHLGAAP